MPQRKLRLAAKAKASPAPPTITPATATVSSTVSFAQVPDAEQAMQFARQMDMDGDDDYISLKAFMKERTRSTLPPVPAERAGLRLHI